MNDSRIIGIIPARGGSKGLPRKNILPLGGIPVIAHTIKAALGCAAITRTVVSTEDAEISAIAKHYGATVMDRPAALAADDTQVHDVVAHLIETLARQGEAYDHLVLLQPTSPLRNAEQLRRSLEAYAQCDCRSLVGVTECDHHPYKTVTVTDNVLKPLVHAKGLESRRQDLPPAYRITGAIYILPVDVFMQDRTFIVNPAFAYPMSAESSIDIDSAMDLAIAELLLKNQDR